MEESGISDGQATINLRTDSSAAKSLISRSGPGRKTRHIQTKCLCLQDIIRDGQAKVFKIGTHENTADILTKYLTGDIMEKLSGMLGVHQLAESHRL